MKRMLENLSDEMGFGGEINDAVLLEGGRRLDRAHSPTAVMDDEDLDDDEEILDEDDEEDEEDEEDEIPDDEDDDFDDDDFDDEDEDDLDD